MEWEAGEPVRVSESLPCHTRGPRFGYSVCAPLRVTVEF